MRELSSTRSAAESIHRQDYYSPRAGMMEQQAKRRKLM